MQPVDIIQWVTNVTFVAAGVAAFRVWLRRRESPSARWLLLTFVLIDLIILATLGIDEDTQLPRMATLAILAGIVLFPWALFRFADAVTGSRDWQVRLVTALTAIVIVWGFFLPEFPEPDEPRTPVFVAYLIGLLAAWGIATGASAWRLFRAGSGQPGVIGNRMRLLGAGSLLLTLTLLVSSLDPNSASTDSTSVAEIVSGAIAMVSAWAFLAGFAPPSLLRTWWRRHEEHDLHQSTAHLLSAESPSEVASIVLPPFGRLLGADCIVLSLSDGTELGSIGSRDAFDRAPPWRQLDTSSDKGGLAIRAVMSETAPLLGQDEIEVAERLLLVAGLAVDRAARARELAIANRSLEAANEELESFVYSASHDLKNPLIAMLGYVDLIKHHYPFEPGSDPAMFVDRIDANGWFMSSLIDDLLELSRVGRVEQHEEPTDLNAVVAESRADVAAEFPTLVVAVPAPLPTLRMSPVRARQLVTNVIANAGRHGGEGTEIVITAERGAGDQLRLVFQDDGPGIDPGQAERIFRVFERLESERSDGNGIGLAICRKIAQSLGGDMVLEPSETGARFVMTLPADRVQDSTGADRTVDLRRGRRDGRRDGRRNVRRGRSHSSMTATAGSPP